MAGSKAFFKKELMEQLRTGRFPVLLFVSLLIGVLAPLMAYMTPQLMELMSDSIEGSGLSYTGTQTDAFTSWGQFHKNMPLLIIAYILVFSGSFTSEYQRGTLITILTRGLTRISVLSCKTIVILIEWTAGYLICFGTCLIGTQQLWPDDTVFCVAQSSMCWYLFGCWILSVEVFFGCMLSGIVGVLAATGVTFIVIYAFGFISWIKPYLPSYLCEAMRLMKGELTGDDMLPALIVTGISLFIFMLLAAIHIRKREI